MQKIILLVALAALPLSAASESRAKKFERILNSEDKSHASCTDKKGITHHADCHPPYRAYCREPEPGECQCGCVYPIF